MDYVVRILDDSGRLKKEGIMFNEVRVLDKDGNLKKVIKSKILSQRHWKELSSYSESKRKRKNNFNVYGKTKSSYESFVMGNY